MTDQEYRERMKAEAKGTGRLQYGHSCQTVEHSAWLSEKFGLDFAMRITGMTEEQLEALLGRNKKGARKGLLKGQITWTKVIIGGWKRDGAGEGNGHVVQPGRILSVTINDPWKPIDYIHGAKDLFKMNEWDINRRREAQIVNGGNQ